MYPSKSRRSVMLDSENKMMRCELSKWSVKSFEKIRHFGVNLEIQNTNESEMVCQRSVVPDTKSEMHKSLLYLLPIHLND